MNMTYNVLSYMQTFRGECRLHVLHTFGIYVPYPTFYHQHKALTAIAHAVPRDLS